MQNNYKDDLLLVIDMQNVYNKGQKWECRNTKGAAENIKKIIEVLPKQNVIFTEYIADTKNARGVWKDYNIKYKDVNNDEYANLMVNELKEIAGEYPVYSKSVYSSLAVPQVLEACKKAKRVIVTGVVAECCVLSTVMALIDQGIYTLYITDAVSGLDEPKEKATELILSGLCPLHVNMLTTRDYLNLA